MLYRLRYLWAFLLMAAAALLLHCLAIALPCPATAVVAPVCASPWELGKRVFWPYLCGTLLLWRLEPAGCRGSHCAALLSAAVLMILLCRLNSGYFPTALCWMLSTGSGLLLHGLVLHHRLRGGALLWYLLAILLGVAYLLLTAIPLTGGIFLDPRDAAAIAAIPF